MGGQLRPEGHLYSGESKDEGQRRWGGRGSSSVSRHPFPEWINEKDKGKISEFSALATYKNAASSLNLQDLSIDYLSTHSHSNLGCVRSVFFFPDLLAFSYATATPSTKLQTPKILEARRRRSLCFIGKEH